METLSVLDEFSPYEFWSPIGNSRGRWLWSHVLETIGRARRDRRFQPELPPQAQTRNALIGLSVGLAFRQLAINAEAKRLNDLRIAFGG
jgi:hypothetical protein